MSKNNPKTPKEVTRLAEDRGFRRIRQCGSHATYAHPNGSQVTICQGHHGDIPKGTLHNILKIIIGAGMLLVVWEVLSPVSFETSMYHLYNLLAGVM
jgi:predicted RNA binding protein YcfA (HicA-like mRNA interferase family)